MSKKDKVLKSLPKEEYDELPTPSSEEIQDVFAACKAAFRSFDRIQHSKKVTKYIDTGKHYRHTHVVRCLPEEDPRLRPRNG